MDYFEASDEDTEEYLTWRLDPDESLSDWTLEIEKQQSGVVDTYHVHKNMLAVGPCKGEYFCGLFRTQMRESETNTSRIGLDDAAAEVVPTLLDFVYSPVHNLEITSESATALRYLAEYFGMKLLHRKVVTFCKNDMTMDNLHHYIDSAKLFCDAKMLSMATDMCIENIEDLDPSSELLKMLDPDLFYQIISSPEIDTCSVSCHISNVVAAYCKIHQGEMDEETFDKLTDRRFIPLVDKESALAFLELQACDGESATQEKDKTSSATTTSCLQKRCIKVLAQNWEDLADDQHKSVVQSFPPHVTTELFQRSLATAKNDRAQCLQSVASELDVRVKKITDRLQNAAQLAEQQVKQERLEKRQLEDELRGLRTTLLDRDRELAEYRREWSRLKRVPVKHSFRDSTRCTYHHQSASEPYDNPNHSTGQYGKLRPTAMPAIGDSAEDGYLFLEKNGLLLERWPMFYYKDR